MARLHEYQGKAILTKFGLDVPDGRVVHSANEAATAAKSLGGRVVIKAQAWVTGRAAVGGVKFADTPDQAHDAAAAMLQLTFGNFPVTELLVEQAIDITNEVFVSFSIDDAAQAPILLLDAQGGTGIEDRAATVHTLPVDVRKGVSSDDVASVLAESSIDAAQRPAVVDAIARVAEIARQCEARSVEINPLTTTADGRVVAADCRMTIDDYAVFRHPELGIDIARELDHPATTLERIAYDIEQADHRGTFYFAQLAVDDAGSSRGVIGFHGAGGGGSMMSMDAITNVGFTLANFCDTSGNPSAAKVYRAARVILTQPGLVGYFGSGSGVASQEQYHSAYGLAKAFCELELSIPAVIRLGGNSEDRAVEILQDACRSLPAIVEGYRKDDPPARIAERLAQLVQDADGAVWSPRSRSAPSFVGSAYQIPIAGGSVWIDHDLCDQATTAFVVQHSQELLRELNGRPVLRVAEEDIATKDSELIALEIECRRRRTPVVFVDLPIEGIDNAG